MKSSYWLLFGLIAVLSSCMWGVPNKQKADITTDTLTYSYRTIIQRAADCGNKPDSGCTVVKIKYPVFNNQPQFNDIVAKSTLRLYKGGDPDDKPATSLQQLAKNFVKGYESDNLQSYTPDMFYTLNLKTSIVRQDSSIITLQLDGYDYEGGSHGALTTNFVNWNTKSQRNIYLNDILINNYKEKLTAIGDTIFRKQEKLNTSASLAKDYFFTHHKFALNDNYLITPLGIRFLYNQYEIKPYAAGQTDLFIPYSKIKSLLRPNTVITQYLK